MKHALMPAAKTGRGRMLAATLAALVGLGWAGGLRADEAQPQGVNGSAPVTPPSAAQGHLQPGDFVAIIGDSITEQRDYSVNIETYLLACRPAPDLRAMQFGWGGETAQGFKTRMVNDCLRFKPSVATTCYGMNDGGYGPLAPDRARWYHDNQKAVVQTLKSGGVRFVVIGSPGCVDVNTFRGGNTQQAEVYNKTLAQERDIARQVAQEEGVTFADVFTPMHEVMTKSEAKYGKKYHVAGGDGVHPAANGHLVMAYAFLKGLGCDGNIGTITIDAAGGKAEASEGHQVLNAQIGKDGGTVQVESRRYPFCFTGDNLGETNSTKGVLEFLPFNQELNRLTLVVKGASTLGPKVKVTWGDASKIFDAAQLEQGINLAGEFLDNPFKGPLAALRMAVAVQQNYETPMIKNYVNSLTSMVGPEEKEAVDRVIAAMAKRDRGLFDQAAAKVGPVTHTIRIEPAK